MRPTLSKNTQHHTVGIDSGGVSRSKWSHIDDGREEGHVALFAVPISTARGQEAWRLSRILDGLAMNVLVKAVSM